MIALPQPHDTPRPAGETRRGPARLNAGEAHPAPFAGPGLHHPGAPHSAAGAPSGRARPLRLCSGRPTCPNRVVRGKCPECARASERARGNFRQRGYTTTFSRFSVQIRRQFPLCGMRPDGAAPVMSRCHDLGIATPGTDVDHVVPLRQRPDLLLEPSNVQVLCRVCHSRKTAAGL